MSFRIMQFNPEQIGIKMYENDFPFIELNNIERKDVVGFQSGQVEYYFKESVISLSSLNNTNETNMDITGKTYYFRARLSYNSALKEENASFYDRLPLNRNVIIKLVDSNNNEQYIDEVKISKNGSGYLLQTIFKPVKNFSQIQICFERTAEDLTNLLNSSQESGNNQYWMNADYVVVTGINDGTEDENHLNPQIFEISTSSVTNNQIKKLGIQGTPGLLLCINGEPIRIGPNGIYEIKNGYKINLFNILLKTNAETFILDLLVEENT